MGEHDHSEILDQAFEKAPIGACFIDRVGVFVRVNPAGARLVGRAPAEIVGRNLAEIAHPDDLVVAVTALSEILSRGTAGPFDVRVLRPDDGWVWLRCRGTLLPTTPSTTLVTVEDAGSSRELVEQLDLTAQQFQVEHMELVRRSKALSDLATLVTTVDDPDALIVGVAGLAIRHLCPLVGVLLLDGDDDMRVAHLAHRNAEAEALLREALSGEERPTFDMTGKLGQAVSSGQALVNFTDDVHPDLAPRVEEFERRFPTGARCVIPLRAGTSSLGALVLLRAPDEPDFSPADVDLVSVLASRTAAAVENARLDALRAEAEAVNVRRAAQQAAIAQLGAVALSGAPLDDLVARCRELVESTLGVHYCGVLVNDRRPGDLPLLAYSDSHHPSDPRPPYRTDPRLLAALDRETAILIPDVRAETRFELNPELEKMGVRSLAVSRIESRGGARGTVSVGSTHADALGPDHATFLDAMANVLASAIDARQALDEMRHNALHDALTGLPNRVLLLDRLEMALQHASAHDTRVAVLICDVDRFKIINDGLGHAAGDAVLRAVAQRLTLHIRPGDTVGRFGGDEFVVVCPDVQELGDVMGIAERLGEAFTHPMRVLGNDLVATASIGIALGRDATPEAATGLLRDADAAMYRAKARGRARFELFDDDMRERARHRLRMETELRRAMDNGELVLHYQPVVTAKGLRPVGAEALVRWDHPTQGLLQPKDFLNIAAECGLIPDLGAWAFEEAARQLAAWTAAEAVPLEWVAVNLAPQQLTDSRLLERLDDALERSAVDSTRMRVEITEEALVEDTRQSAAVLQGLRDRGLRISVDDFGTGYSSLAYLKRLPVDCVKLDGGFVRGLGEDDDDLVIAAAVIVMAQALGLHVVAECVERQSQLDVLRTMGCDQAQGHLFCGAIPADDLPVWLARHT
ncbi:MAG: EAL domain-containing protein [Acidimicrobiales bacterium]